MPNPWYQIKAKATEEDAPSSAEIFIFGDIGESWWDETVTAKQFVKDIAAIDAEQITVRINSYGGSVTDGIAIYNAIKRHPATVTVSIEAAAYSIASLIAMAGDTVEMAENALLMIHAPWGYAAGNSAEMREFADMLDKYAQSMTSSYVSKSGQDQAAILALLTDGKDHWYSAEEAKEAGFVDSITNAVTIAASARIQAAGLTRFTRNPAAAAAHPPKETTMPNQANPQAAAPANVDAAAVLAAEKSRRESIRAEFAPFASHEGMAAIQAACEDDHSVTAEMAAQKILAHLAKQATPVGATHVETVEDETDKQRASITASLLVRAGVADQATRQAARASAHRGAKLLDLAKASLDRAGIRYAHMDQMQIVAAAFTQGTSDFPILLENAMHKALQTAYATAPDTWSRFCATGSVSDFRAHNRYRVGSLGNLDPLNELGEFKNKSIPDGEKASVIVGTKGNIINLSRRAVINDDLGAFIGLAAQLGRAGRRTIEAAVYALLAENSGLGPVMSDDKTLFHADHGNIGQAGAISVTTIEDGRVKMALQTDHTGNEFLDLRPTVFLCPLSLGGQARVINDAQYDPDTANKMQRPNMVRGLFRDVVDTPRLTGTRNYMFADPAEAPVIEVAFLDGNQEPVVEQQAGFTVDGTQYKVRLDFGVAAVDYRGAVTNAGQ
jgi:ATP-dependent Clp endopeptidase proteolytic subunit ClpP